MSQAGERILQGAREALAIATGAFIATFTCVKNDEDDEGYEETRLLTESEKDRLLAWISGEELPTEVFAGEDFFGEPFEVAIDNLVSLRINRYEA